jgi:hypothetical protein
VIRVQELRNKAELFRRVARTPAGRDPRADRELLILADRFEQEADARLEYLQRQSKNFPADS